MMRKHAMLCLDCDEISLIATHCPICASEVVVPISKWIPSLEEAKEIMGKRENVIEAIAAEAEDMLGRMTAMIAEVDDDPEPLGVGA